MRLRGPLAVAVAFTLLVPGFAHAAELIGQTGTMGGSCTDDEAYVQKTLTSGAGYSPSVSGVITSWRAAGDPDLAQTIVLMVLRPDSATQFTSVGSDIVRTLTPNTLNTFTGLHLPIESSQRIAVYLPAGSTASCVFNSGNPGDTEGFSVPFGVGQPPIGVPFDYSGSDIGVRVNAQAVVEPDCDNDGLGDETQDTNLSGCAPGTIPPPAPGAATATCKGLNATIVGTNGSDVRTGSQGQDVIAGLGGNDTLSGLGGNDVICGGAGKDTLKGGKGKDSLLGQKGKDALNGGPSRDLCKGGKGTDTASKCEVEKSI
jgi:Ca2+-binding RTX toxin-like protein